MPASKLVWFWSAVPRRASGRRGTRPTWPVHRFDIDSTWIPRRGRLRDGASERDHGPCRCQCSRPSSDESTRLSTAPQGAFARSASTQSAGGCPGSSGTRARGAALQLRLNGSVARRVLDLLQGGKVVAVQKSQRRRQQNLATKFRRSVKAPLPRSTSRRSEQEVTNKTMHAQRATNEQSTVAEVTKIGTSKINHEVVNVTRSNTSESQQEVQPRSSTVASKTDEKTTTEAENVDDSQSVSKVASRI